eukprot:TRINITY_DN4330_c0_g1_i1.p3 TRINITY_DN4330_c0_g1~~TRINITY_DN4330_c0_g1_i1.p3  ORF type:complete len:137 (-),score=18.67 TRINITY_DN4330_c0_g1_i1:60-470(-)
MMSALTLEIYGPGIVNVPSLLSSWVNPATPMLGRFARTLSAFLESAGIKVDREVSVTLRMTASLDCIATQPIRNVKIGKMKEINVRNILSASPHADAMPRNAQNIYPLRMGNKLKVQISASLIFSTQRNAQKEKQF